MAERDLLFHDTVAPCLAGYKPEASATQQREIDRQVYALYGLTPAERDLVEESAKK